MLGLITLITACGSQANAATSVPPTQSLTIFAAASLSEAFTDIAAEFESQHPEVDLVLNFAGSQTLRLQIEQGAQVDVFASANEIYMQTLVEADLMQNPTIFTHNELLVITPATNPAAIKTLADLSQPGLKLILAGQSVPAGRYANQVLENLSHDPLLGRDYAQRVRNNLVSEEDSVKGVVTKVRLGEADAGLVYASDVTPSIASEVQTISVPLNFNVKAAYPVAVSSGSHQAGLAQQFVDFVLAPEGQIVLANYGFEPSNIQLVGQR